MSPDPRFDYSDLRALFINCTLKHGPEPSNTQALMDVAIGVMEAQGVTVDQERAVDLDLPAGVQPDMREHGAATDDWPALFERVMAADILVLGAPIWLGQKSSVSSRVIERLYGNSGQLNDKGQWIYYGRAGGAIITGNEDGAKHCAMEILYSLQHLGYVIPPQADSCWLGEAGPGPSYADDGVGRPAERVHPAQHGLHGLEPHARRRDAEARRWHPRLRQPAQGMGRRLRLRPPEPRVPVARRGVFRRAQARPSARCPAHCD